MQNDNKVNFQRILDSLNPNQRKAVDQIDGPVMVVAGPGTGKTQILSARIANILMSTDVGAQSILCLTYTEAGAKAMQKRLIEMIGTEAYNVSVQTFHSFGAQVIRENESLFGNRALQPLSALENEQILREILNELSSSSVLKSNKEYTYHAKSLKEIFAVIKTQGLKPAKLLKDIDDYIAEMPLLDEFRYKIKRGDNKAGDPNIGRIAKTETTLNYLKQAVSLYNVYLDKMAQKSRFDFADMLIWVRDAFEKYPNLLLSYRERYLYILVDEFQDNNGIQTQILNLLASAEEQPNVFVVGDDDQSIFSFQGANYEIMLNFDKDYHPTTVVLDMNYRSSQKILDASKALIENNTQRLVSKKSGLIKELIASNPNYKDLPTTPLIVEYSVDNEETVMVAGEIEKLIREQNVEPENIAVIYRMHKQAIEISNYLVSKGIPIYTARPVNILEESMIQNILKLLEYIQLESKKSFLGDHLVFEILHFDCFELDALDIAKFALEIAPKKQKNWRSEIAEKAKRPSQSELFENNNFINKLRRVHENLEYWIKQSFNVTVAELIEKIIAKGGFLSHALSSEQKNWNMQVLKTFFDYVKNETERNPYLKLSEFLDAIKLMRELNLSIEIKRIYGSTNGVNLLTAHASKGLEFDHVFMIGCNEKTWVSRDNKLPFELSRILLHNNPYGNVSNDKGAMVEESRRLFFVALTRAKKSIQISYSSEHDNETQFITELISSGTVERKAEHKSDDLNQSTITLTNDFIAAQFAQPENTQSRKVEDAWLDSFVNNYSMSVSYLNKYLQCPLAFYYEKILKIPTAKNKYTGFGSAIHDTLDDWIKEANNNPNHEFWNAEWLCNKFEEQMGYQRDAFTDEGFKHMLEYGKEKLIYFYKRKIDYIRKVPKILTEQRIRTEVEGIKINGVADRLDFTDNTAHLIDYKTGSIINGKKKLLPPIEGAASGTTLTAQYGGDYWRQLVFYKILVENSGFNWIIDSAEIEFIEVDEDDADTHKLFIGPNDVEIVKEQIKMVDARIKAKDFQNGCGDKDCHWCNFEKHYMSGKNYVFEELPEEGE